MHRIDTPTAQKDKFGAGKNGFTRGNPQTGTPATDLDDDYFDMIQEELASVVEATNVTLDKSKRNQLLTAIRALLTGLNLKSASQRDVGTGTNQIPDMNSFQSGSNGLGSWFRLPSGILIQFGLYPASGPTGGIGFPTPFTAVPQYSLSPTATSGVMAVSSGASTTAINNVRTFDSAGNTLTNGVSWTAIGK